jgi:hypothetical protein
VAAWLTDGAEVVGAAAWLPVVGLVAAVGAGAAAPVVDDGFADPPLVAELLDVEPAPAAVLDDGDFSETALVPPPEEQATQAPLTARATAAAASVRPTDRGDPIRPICNSPPGNPGPRRRLKTSGGDSSSVVVGGRRRVPNDNCPKRSLSSSGGMEE